MGLFIKKLRSSDLKHGRSDFFLPDISEIPKDPQEAYHKIKGRIEAAGWGFKRRGSKTEHGRKFTMTMRKNIYLSGRWDSYPIWKKAAILWHEYIHVLQRERWGDAKFLARYATARGRWFIEAPAYRMSIRVYERMSGGKFNATEYVENKLVEFRKSYWLGTINKSQYVKETRAIWLKERT